MFLKAETRLVTCYYYIYYVSYETETALRPCRPAALPPCRPRSTEGQYWDPGGCFNKYDGPSDQATDHSAMDKQMGGWSDARSDSPACLLKQAPGLRKRGVGLIGPQNIDIACPQSRLNLLNRWPMLSTPLDSVQLCGGHWPKKIN